MAAINKNITVQKWIVLLGSLLLCIKFFAYFITHSVAILTDALESIVNVVAGFIGWYSLHVAAKPRDTEHPYGHGKAEFVSAAFEGILIVLASIYILIEAVYHLVYPQTLHQLDWGILLIAFSGLINFIIGKWAISSGQKTSSMAVKASGKHLVSDAYSTAALLIGVGILSITKMSWIDSVIAIIFSFIILFTGYNILRESIAGIMDEADEKLLKNLIDKLQKNRKENWIDLHNLRVIKYGNQMHIDCHLTLPWYFNLKEAHAEIDDLYQLISENFGDAMEIFVHTDGCLDFSCNICEKQNCASRKHVFEKQIGWTMQNIFANEKHKMET